MITTARVAREQIVFEETKLTDVQKRLGGEIGYRGDGGEALGWLCFHGTDASGRWALWLESSEIGGGTVDGLALQRLEPNTRVDPRCPVLREGDGGFSLPVALRLGVPEAQVRKILGRPTARTADTVIFCHEHKEIINKEPFVASNTVAVAFRAGFVWAIQVWKNTTS